MFRTLDQLDRGTSVQNHDPPIQDVNTDLVTNSDVFTEVLRKEALLKTGALQNAILNSDNFSIIATDEKGVIQIVSTTSVSPSHLPAEFPNQSGSGFFGCGRPSVWTISKTFHASYKMAYRSLVSTRRTGNGEFIDRVSPWGRQRPV